MQTQEQNTVISSQSTRSVANESVPEKVPESSSLRVEEKDLWIEALKREDFEACDKYEIARMEERVKVRIPYPTTLTEKVSMAQIVYLERLGVMDLSRTAYVRYLCEVAVKCENLLVLEYLINMCQAWKIVVWYDDLTHLCLKEGSWSCLKMLAPKVDTCIFRKMDEESLLENWGVVLGCVQDLPCYEEVLDILLSKALRCGMPGISQHMVHLRNKPLTPELIQDAVSGGVETLKDILSYQREVDLDLDYLISKLGLGSNGVLESALYILDRKLAKVDTGIAQKILNEVLYFKIERVAEFAMRLVEHISSVTLNLEHFLEDASHLPLLGTLVGMGYNVRNNYGMFHALCSGPVNKPMLAMLDYGFVPHETHVKRAVRFEEASTVDLLLTRFPGCLREEEGLEMAVENRSRSMIELFLNRKEYPKDAKDKILSGLKENYPLRKALDKLV